MAIPYLACMLATARAEGLPPRVLPAIQRVEGGTVGSVHRNDNGSQDYGVMQVNSVWLAMLARRTGWDAAVVRERLITDGCFNIAVAGMIMRRALDETSGDLLKAVGFYNSHTQAVADRYTTRVMQAAHTIFAIKG